MSRLSFEFYPPKSELAADRLWHAIEELSAWQPHYVTVTCGAGGSALAGTFGIVSAIRKRFGLNVAPHIAFSRLGRLEIADALTNYKAIGVNRIVAIRGDVSTKIEAGPVDPYTNTVEFVNDLCHKYVFEVSIGGYPDVHPQALSPQQDLDHLKRKVDAGASQVVTQFFFEADTFLRFRDKVRTIGVSVPIIPGIMPVHDIKQIVHFAAGCGAVVPSGFTGRFERHGQDQAAHFQEGVNHATELCNQLKREGIDDFHFYALNRGEIVSTICANLGFDKRT